MKGVILLMLLAVATQAFVPRPIYSREESSEEVETVPPKSEEISTEDIVSESEESNEENVIDPTNSEESHEENVTDPSKSKESSEENVTTEAPKREESSEENNVTDPSKSKESSEENVTTESPKREESSEENNVTDPSQSVENNCVDICLLIPHETRCDQFYKCGHGQLVIHTCPSQLAFNLKEQTCDWASNVDCEGKVIPEPETEESVEVEAIEDGDSLEPIQPDEICKSGVLYPHDIRCDQFYQCVHGQPVTLTCPSSLVFNYEAQACDWPSVVDCGSKITSQK